MREGVVEAGRNVKRMTLTNLLFLLVGAVVMWRWRGGVRAFLRDKGPS